MCLLIAGNAAQIRSTLLNTADLLEDIFASNADGVGAMYTTSKGVLRTPKVLPKNLAEARAFIAQLPNDDRSIAIHWRMRTHGDTDLTNCHPYPVIEGQIALMHNGVLQQGNAADKSKSDTWHYINDVVRPMLSEAPKMFTNKAWLELVENDITTSNRFAIMDHEGDLVILNKQTGIEHEGIWFSNTYAWSPELLIPGYKKVWKLPKHWRGVYPSFGTDDDEYDTWYGTGKGHTNLTAKGSVINNESEVEEISEDDVWAAVSTADHAEVADLIEANPDEFFRILMTDCEFALDRPDADDFTKSEQEVVELLLGGKPAELAQLAKTRSATFVACMGQIICWYGQWYGKPINANEASAKTTIGTEAEYEEAVQNFLDGQSDKPTQLALVPVAAEAATEEGAEQPDYVG